MEGINSIILSKVFDLAWNHRIGCIWKGTLKDYLVPTPAMSRGPLTTILLHSFNFHFLYGR